MISSESISYAIILLSAMMVQYTINTIEIGPFSGPRIDQCFQKQVPTAHLYCMNNKVRATRATSQGLTRRTLVSCIYEKEG